MVKAEATANQGVLARETKVININCIFREGYEGPAAVVTIDITLANASVWIASNVGKPRKSHVHWCAVLLTAFKLRVLLSEFYLLQSK